MRASYDKFDANMTDAEVLEFATFMVDECVEVLERLAPGEDILDENLLPSSREGLENGFRLAIATTMQPSRRRHIVALGNLLAQFQSGVGQRITFSPADSGGFKGNTDPAFGRHLERILKRSEEDRVRLARLFAEADDFARRRFENAARPPFHDDGTYSWYGHGLAH